VIYCLSAFIQQYAIGCRVQGLGFRAAGSEETAALIARL
jgi:hypothetical protein